MLDINKLSVLVTAGGVPASKGWHKPAASIFPAESCARHIYVHLKENDEQIPLDVLNAPETQRYTGIAAYAFFLRFYCGLLNSKTSDQHVVFQAVSAWKQYVEKHGEHKALLPYMSALFHDGAKIRSTMLEEHVRHSSPVRCAVKLANVKPTDKVFVISGGEAITVETIQALTDHSRQRPNTLTVTYSDAEMRNRVMVALCDSQNFKRIAGHIKFVSLETVLDHSLLEAKSVFVCLPMAQKADLGSPLAQLNLRIAEAWYIRVAGAKNPDARLFHLKGCPEFRGETTDPWLGMDIENHGFIPFTDLRTLHSQAITFARQVNDKAIAVTEDIAKLRLSGDRVKHIAFNPETMSVEYHLAKRQLGFQPTSCALTQDSTSTGPLSPMRSFSRAMSVGTASRSGPP